MVIEVEGDVAVAALVEQQLVADPFVLVLGQDLLLAVVPRVVEEDLIEEVAVPRLLALLEVDWRLGVDADACGVWVVEDPVVLRIDHVLSLRQVV